MDVDTIRNYHSAFDPQGIIVKICDAIIDKREGMGLLWISADFERWFRELAQYPSASVIGQDRDELRRIVIECGYKIEQVSAV